jgi:hypothetical protein
MLAQTGEVVGETQKALSMYGQLQKDNKLAYKIPFPLAMDKLTKIDGIVSEDKVLQFIHGQIPEFDSQPEDYRNQIIQRVKDYMKTKEYSAETFEKFALQGTPSMILVDRKGILRDVSFGQSGNVEAMIQKLLSE